MAKTKSKRNANEIAAKPANTTNRKNGAGAGFPPVAEIFASARDMAQKVRSGTGRTLARTGSGLAKSGKRSASVLSKFYSGRVQPFLGRSGSWLARRLHPGSVDRDYRRLLLLVHKFGPDRSVERLFFIPTARHVPLSIVRMPHQLRRSGHDYRPTPRLVFEWAMGALPEPVDRYRFVDYGAGRGRVLAMASHYPFENITGVEVGEELHGDCLLNIAQYPRSLMKCRDIDCENLGALRLDIPQGETVFYFNNPFNTNMFERVIGQIVRAYKQEPYRFYVICVDIADREAVEDAGIFQEVALPWRTRLKTVLFSPYSIRLYRTVY